MKICIPVNKKAFQSFIGKINFIRWFIPNFAKIIKHITEILKKEKEVNWSNEARLSFEKIKQALIKAAVLISLDFAKYFSIFSFAFEDTIDVVLLQKIQMV